MKRILFLDVDGVLNHKKSVSFYALSRAKLRLLRKIHEEVPYSVVLSSTWRFGAKHFHKIKLALEFRGIPLISKTVRADHYDLAGTERGYEIDHWLKFNSWDSYCIVDDDGDMLEYQYPHFVQTNGEVGLTPEDAQAIVKILKHV